MSVRAPFYLPNASKAKDLDRNGEKLFPEHSTLPPFLSPRYIASTGQAPADHSQDIIPDIKEGAEMLSYDEDLGY